MLLLQVWELAAEVSVWAAEEWPWEMDWQSVSAVAVSASGHHRTMLAEGADRCTVSSLGAECQQCNPGLS